MTGIGLCAGVMIPETAFAQPTGVAGISGADTAWVLVSAVLVLQ